MLDLVVCSFPTIDQKLGVTLLNPTTPNKVALVQELEGFYMTGDGTNIEKGLHGLVEGKLLCRMVVVKAPEVVKDVTFICLKLHPDHLLSIEEDNKQG
jgi:hypothetical protein